MYRDRSSCHRRIFQHGGCLQKWHFGSLPPLALLYAAWQSTLKPASHKFVFSLYPLAESWACMLLWLNVSVQYPYMYMYMCGYIYIFLFFFFLTAVGHALDVVVTDRNRRGNTVNTSAHLDHYRVREFTPGGRNTTKECQIVSEPPNKQTTCWTIQANLHSLGLHAVWQRS